MRLELFAFTLLAIVFVLTDVVTANKAVVSEQAACASVKRRVHKQFPEGASCRFLLPSASGDPDILVMRLNSSRPCGAVDCSNLLGWYAVRKSTKKVYKWNVGDMGLGALLP